MKLIPPARRRRAHLSQFTTTHLHLRHPLIVAFFSFSFPGFGNFMQHRYATAFILIVWELFIHTKAHVNTGILYSLLGDFEKAKELFATLVETTARGFPAVLLLSFSIHIPPRKHNKSDDEGDKPPNGQHGHRKAKRHSLNRRSRSFYVICQPQIDHKQIFRRMP